MSIRIAKMGYFSGDPSAVLNAPVDIVCDIISVEEVQHKIEQNYIRKAKEQRK